MRRSSDAGLSQIPFNLTSTAPIVTPVPADYTGDGKADAAIWGSQQCLTGEPTPSPPAPAPIPAFFCPQGGGGAGLGNMALDLPVPADYDGDGKVDFAVYRKTSGVWTVQRSSGGTITVSWGAPALGDTPVPADYDGDGKADIAVYRKLTGEWLIRRSSDGGVSVVAWGAPTLGDVPIPANYTGSGRADVAVYRRLTGQWFIHPPLFQWRRFPDGGGRRVRRRRPRASERAGTAPSGAARPR